MEWLLLHKGGREKEARSRREQIARLKEDLRGLAENQVLGRDSPPMQLKRILEEELRTRNGEPVPVDIFCEAMEIRDPAWRNAIEGYLYHRKFDILVPPDYFKAALALYRKYRLSHGLEDVGLVNTASLLQEAPVAPERSLASEIDAEIDYIRAYADRLLGGVVKCESEDELPQHAAAITPAGMLYQDHSIRQIPRAYFELPYIGKEAVRFQLARKREALQEEERLLAEAERQIAAAASAGYLALDKTDRYRAWAQELEQLQGKAELEEGLAAQDRELLSLDSGELDRLKENLSRRESSLGSLKKELERAIGERGGLEERISNLGGAIEALQQAAEAERAGCEAYLAALSGSCRKNVSKVGARGGAEEPGGLYQNYRSSNEEPIPGEKLRPALVKLRTEFVYAFHFSGIGAEDNEAFRQRQRLLVESHLQDYEARARAAREQAEQSFQENFVARLGEFIKLAEEEIKELNRALKDMRFGTDAYRFSLTPKKDTRRYYEMIMDTGVYQGSIFREAFFQKHGDTITDLFNEITRGGDDFPENVSCSPTTALTWTSISLSPTRTTTRATFQKWPATNPAARPRSPFTWPSWPLFTRPTSSTGRATHCAWWSSTRPSTGWMPIVLKRPSLS